jgi:anti-sigma factor RsiW
MLSDHEIDETTLHAYVDRQLDLELHQAVLHAMLHDAGVRQRVGELRMTKDWMQTGFAVTAEKPGAPAGRCSLPDMAGTALAASVMALGIGSGVLGYLCADSGLFAGAVQDQPQRVVLHLDESQPERFRTVSASTQRGECAGGSGGQRQRY